MNKFFKKKIKGRYYKNNKVPKYLITTVPHYNMQNDRLNNVGKLELIIGPMFSGKSSELYREGSTRLAVLTDETKVLLVNSSKDSRCENEIKTHDGHIIHAIKVYHLQELFDREEYKIAEIILIDEGQFFDDLYNFAQISCDVHHKHVIIAGLDGDFQQKKFGHIIDLIPMADSVTKLNALCKICMDGTTPAPFTKRITSDTSQELVGAADKYIAVCRKHK